MPTLQDVSTAYPHLTRKQKRILDALLEDPKGAMYITLKDLAAKAEVSEVSVLRLCRSLGFEGFQDMRDRIRRECPDLTGRDAETASPYGTGTREAALREVLTAEGAFMDELLSGIDSEQLFACSSTLLHSDRIEIFGHDGCKILGDFLSHRLNHFRLTAVSIQMGNTEVVQQQLMRLRKGDAVVLFSLRDYYSRARTIARYAAQREIPVYVITDGPESPAVPDATCAFYCPTAARGGVNSFTSLMSFINILTQCIAYELGDKALAEIEESMRRVNRFITEDPDK